MGNKFIPRNMQNAINSIEKPSNNLAYSLTSESGNAGDKPKSIFRNIPVEEITPRFINRYSQRRIEELAKSIRNTGDRLVHPIVIVDVVDLPNDSEIIQSIKENNQDKKDFHYIIVSGERRYRAWMKLRADEAERLKDDPRASNRYDTITANILTYQEAQNEERFYQDANDLTRHESPEDTIWFIKDILKELDTDEAKYNALKEMNFEGNFNMAMAPTKFPTYKYVAYRLKRDRGIDDWSEGTIKNQLVIASNCHDKIADALLERKISVNDAKTLSVFNREVQEDLLETMKEDTSLYNERLEQEKNNIEKLRDKKAKSPTHADARKIFRADLKKIKEDKKNIEKIIQGLGESNSENERYIITKYEEFINELEQIIRNAK